MGRYLVNSVMALGSFHFNNHRITFHAVRALEFRVGVSSGLFK